jgi:hypothetical protein
MLRVIRLVSYFSWTECPVITNSDAPDSLDAIVILLLVSENPSDFVGLVRSVRGALPIRRSFPQKPYTLHGACIVGHTIENRLLLPPDKLYDPDTGPSASRVKRRANIQLSCVPDEYPPFLGPNGFTNGVGPGNLGLSVNLSVLPLETF